MSEQGRRRVDDKEHSMTKAPDRVMSPLHRIRNSIANIEQAALEIDGGDALADVLSKLAMFNVAVDVLEAELAMPTLDEPVDSFKEGVENTTTGVVPTVEE